MVLNGKTMSQVSSPGKIRLKYGYDITEQFMYIYLILIIYQLRT